MFSIMANNIKIFNWITFVVVSVKDRLKWSFPLILSVINSFHTILPLISHVNVLHTCVLLVTHSTTKHNNSSSCSCGLSRGLRVQGSGVCCCDWMRVRGNATHAWTHRPAHSCVKNTLLVFSGHGSGRDPETLGRGETCSHTPLCVGLSRDLAELPWASCLHEKMCSPSSKNKRNPSALISRMVNLAQSAEYGKVENTTFLIRSVCPDAWRSIAVAVRHQWNLWCGLPLAENEGSVLSLAVWVDVV